jgi:hypothetical protein
LGDIGRPLSSSATSVPTATASASCRTCSRSRGEATSESAEWLVGQRVLVADVGVGSESDTVDHEHVDLGALAHRAEATWTATAAQGREERQAKCWHESEQKDSIGQLEAEKWKQPATEIVLLLGKRPKIKMRY